MKIEGKVDSQLIHLSCIVLGMEHLQLYEINKNIDENYAKSNYAIEISYLSTVSQNYA